MKMIFGEALTNEGGIRRGAGGLLLVLEGCC
ncbi:hypothetical protein ABID39_001578 [Bartonella japonica]|uniref:Uncharacterized protein n=1 Tax=Bartonella japonica TaxID=357761 RepID=A0ABV2FQS3_9HYPH